MWTSEVGITHLIFPHSYTCCRKKLEKLLILVAHHIYVLICCYHIITPTLIYIEIPVIKQWKDMHTGNKCSNHYDKSFVLSIQIIIVWHSKLSVTNSEKKEVLDINLALKYLINELCYQTIHETMKQSVLANTDKYVSWAVEYRYFTLLHLMWS
jgi:hypothetical protein